MATEFDIGFETGDFSECTAYTSDADFTINSTNPLFGTYDLKADIVQSDYFYVNKDVTEAGQTQFRWRFYFDPRSITIGNGEMFTIAEWYGDNSGPDAQVSVYFRYDTGTGHRFYFAVWDDENAVEVADYSDVIAVDEKHYIEIYITKATNATSNDGTVEYWVDGVSQAASSSYDNFNEFDDASSYFRFRLLVFSVDAGTSGAVYWDAWKCNNDGSEIGPVASGTPGIRPFGINKGLHRKVTIG